MLIRTPGVYRPQADTRLLAEAMSGAGIAPRSRVLDVCTGTGALAIEAARNHGASVTAVDISRTAVASARLNSRLRGLDIEFVRGDFRTALRDRTFDVVISNPPYVPCRDDGPPRGTARSWDAGIDGRSAIDALCALTPEILSETGILLMVHSALCGVEATLSGLRGAGLKASVVSRATIPFGPVMSGRSAWLLDRGLIEAGQSYEELVVIRADRSRR
ncbi:HemK2/MTQ2 family protein methyltransferase [Nocardia jejuensis]|uniref:HemK2/MTQ2 family protein methyltransferase n=1 Tax=Nocardia jejuensis TaxID=328049 RepID=UPI000833C724|nr:HemK2/MTQ2 family protein methyltransferase [Nocardia jejuensis]